MYLFPLQIQCDVTVTAKSLSCSRQRGGGDSVFEVEPSNKVAIMAHSFIYATVIFRPTAIQSYSAMFEVLPDSAKSKSLTFELQGEGNLPQVSVMRPLLRNSKGYVCMLFQRLSLQHHQTLPLTLKNTGTIPSTVVIEVTRGANVFDLLSPEMPSENDDAEECRESPSPPPGGPQTPVMLQLGVGESADCHIKFTPQTTEKYNGELWVTIKDNMFEKFPVSLVGEGYQSEVSIDNIRGQVDEERILEPEEVADDVEGEKRNSLPNMVNHLPVVTKFS